MTSIPSAFSFSSSESTCEVEESAASSRCSAVAVVMVRGVRRSMPASMTVWMVSASE